MKTLCSGSAKKFIAEKIKNIEFLKMNHHICSAGIKAKILPRNISVTNASAISRAVFFFEIISTSVKVYSMISGDNGWITLIDSNYMMI